MKKAALSILVLLATVVFVGCTDDSDDEIFLQDETSMEFIDPAKDCPELDRNCNGIPDDEE
jgi:hypothetical protein